MIKSPILTNILPMFIGGPTQPLMSHQRMQWSLLEQKMLRLNPCIFPLINLINNVIIQKDLRIADEGSQLPFEQGYVLLGACAGQV